MCHTTTIKQAGRALDDALARELAQAPAEPTLTVHAIEQAFASKPEPTLAGDAAARKQLPMFNGLIGYFPNACAAVSHVSKVGNDQHNAGQPMHWAFDKSIGTGDDILRHLSERGTFDMDGLRHTAKAAWRVLELLERELLAAHPELKPGVNVKGFTREVSK